MPTLLPPNRPWPGHIYWQGAIKSWPTIPVGLLTSGVFFLFYYTLNRYAVNVPITDDFYATLQFLLRYQAPATDRLALLFSQHNEHRIVISRLLALLNYTLLGEIDFRQLLLWQSFFLPGLLAAVCWLFRVNGVRIGPWQLLVLSLLLFSLNTWETYLFNSGSSQSYPALLGMVGALLCLHEAGRQSGLKQGVWWLGAAFSATAATFSFGCGILVWPAGLLLTGLRRQWHMATPWLILGLALVFFYMNGYEANKLSRQPLELIQKHLGVFVRFVVSFPAASFQVPWGNANLWRVNLAACYGIGLVCWVYFGYLTCTGYAHRQPLIYTFIALFFTVGLLIGFSRCRLGVNTAFNSRYQILSAMILIGLYLSVLQRARYRELRWLRLTGWGLLLVFGLSATYQPVSLSAMHEEKINGLRQWAQFGRPTLYVSPKDQPIAGTILKKCWGGIYNPDAQLLNQPEAISER